jgi:hypothetical protein
VGDTRASRKGAATEYADCNCASAFVDAHGGRSLVSRIFSSVAMTRSRAGWIIAHDDPKFWSLLQSICENAHEICALWMKKEKWFTDVIR